MPAVKRLHVLGICGTAMAAVAVLARELGWEVTGSDEGVYPPMSELLARLGIPVRPFDPANLDPAPDLVAIGNALSRGNPELEAVLDAGLPYVSGAQFVGEQVLPGRHPLVVAGTHGKTTTASLAAFLLERAGRKPGFLIGGIPEDFGIGARLGRGECFVLEGDEYDTAFFDKRSKFLHYRPRTLILNNLEFDHADIFESLADIQRQFHHLLRLVPRTGRVIVNADDPNLAEVLARGAYGEVVRFARLGGAEAEWQWAPEREDGRSFTLYRGGRKLGTVAWGMVGAHHAANACAVVAALAGLGLDPERLLGWLPEFSGVRRRMTVVGRSRGVTVIDDFAHHPTAIAGVVRAAKAMMDEGRLWVVVEPRSNTMRRRVHEARLPACFEAADRVVFVPPAARGLPPDQLLDVAAVCRAIGPHAEVLPDAAAIVDRIAAEAEAGDVVLVLSNGGFDGIHRRLLDALGAG